jgi:hypothetical protein
MNHHGETGPQAGLRDGRTGHGYTDRQFPTKYRNQILIRTRLLEPRQLGYRNHAGDIDATDEQGHRLLNCYLPKKAGFRGQRA